MAVEKEELLQFIRDVLSREDSTLLDNGVILCDEIRDEGARLLHAAGWLNQRELDCEGIPEDDEDILDAKTCLYCTKFVPRDREDTSEFCSEECQEEYELAMLTPKDQKEGSREE